MSKILSLAAIVLFTACSASVNKDFQKPPHEEKPEQETGNLYNKADGSIRLVSYNVGSFAKYIKSIDMIAQMMLELKADAVCMNEVDSCTTRSDGLYQPKELAEKMGKWHYYFGKAIPSLGGSYGNAMVLSPQFKNLGTETMLIPKGQGAQVRSCAVFKTDKFILLATHLDHTNNQARLDGVKLITEWAKKYYGDSKTPVFLLGDMNCEPQDEPIVKFKEEWNLLSVQKNTFPSGSGQKAVKCIDFIFALKNNAKYEVTASDVPLRFNKGNVDTASDHLPIYVDVKLK